MKKKKLKEGFIEYNPQQAADSLWSRNTNKKSMKGEDIYKKLGIEDEGHIGIQKPPPMKMMDIVKSWYEEEPSEEGEENSEEGEEDGDS
jgi:hypothetical protein